MLYNPDSCFEPQPCEFIQENLVRLTATILQKPQLARTRNQFADRGIPNPIRWVIEGRFQPASLLLQP